MGDVNFYLKSSESKRATPINLVFYYSGKRLKMSTGLVIEPIYWNTEKQRAKILMEFPDCNFINGKLEELRSLILEINRKYIETGYSPDVATFKESIYNNGKNVTGRESKLSFWEYYDLFCDAKRKEGIKDTITYTRTLKKHLKETEKMFGREISLFALQKKEGGFVELFDDYMMNIATNQHGEVGLSTNTIGKQHKSLKVFLNWVFDNDYHQRFSLKHLPTLMEDIEAIYLTEEEIVSLESLENLSSKKRLIRDLFLIGCETGLRFSDYTQLSKGIFEGGFFMISPKKTRTQNSNNKLIIPISSRFESLCKKYNHDFPSYPSYQISEFNKIIRQLCKEANINSTKLILKRQNGQNIELKKFKYEMVSSHTCRRTFCTLKFLKGMPAAAIMKFSGHRTEKSFMKYLKIDMEVTANKYKSFF